MIPGIRVRFHLVLFDCEAVVELIDFCLMFPLVFCGHGFQSLDFGLLLALYSVGVLIMTSYLLAIHQNPLSSCPL
jgi:hypothetical protein